MALLRHCRAFAAISNSSAPYIVFDRQTKRLQKDRAAISGHSRTVDYLRDEVADRMMERLEDIKRKFDTILDLGSGPGHFAKLLETSKARKCVMVDSSEKTLNRDPDSEFEVDIQRIHEDEENLLQIVEPNSQECIVSCLSLHWVNDLPGALVQVKEALQPDGLFLGAMIGGDTLFELRQVSFTLDREGGISPRISPMTDTRDVSNLLGRAGFTLLTVDVDEVKVAYPSMWELMEDLQHMGESNAVVGRRTSIHRDTLAAASAIYSELHGNEDGTVPATFQIIFMIGWKPSPVQPKPLKRGSGEVNLQNIL
ncbi:S-adenosyl-L-methionine-dependent methyltransferase [Mycena floridula]|nr:S-adenosyl-L-methionine-dependent methyltransferase [Mycena floridula]